ncbi:hypothetical protein PEC18_36960 [Paucibacter sp. O1-1]|nr:hypothetical protein [Paucibacter sp. O1-1]MDA3831245.1 hypothetical protein [Paucibacter sp. O1-1]
MAPTAPATTATTPAPWQITVNGQAFARTWWTLSGDTVTDFSFAAKAMLGRWDTRFDDDYAAWLASQPPVESGN